MGTLSASEFHTLLTGLSVVGVNTNIVTLDGKVDTANLPYKYVDQVQSERRQGGCYPPSRSGRITILVEPEGQGTPDDNMSSCVTIQAALETALDAVTAAQLHWQIEVGLIADYIGDIRYWGVSCQVEDS